MRILITASNEFTVLDNDAELKIGAYYDCEPAESGTLQQGRAWHALVAEYWKSGSHSYTAKSFLEFRDFIKRDLGAGFESYVCVVEDQAGIRWMEVKHLQDISPKIKIATDRDGKRMIKGKLKSWSDYTKKERREAIDLLIAEMIQAQVQTPKFFEILRGLEQVKSNTNMLASEVME
jgi:hypothetical protein